METTKNLQRKNKLISLALGMIVTSIVYAEPAPKYFYGERRKKIAVGVNAPWASLPNRKDIAKYGFTPANADEIEQFNRTDASCDMKCSGRVSTGGHVTYDDRIACKRSCMVSEGWSLIKIEEGK